MRLGKWGTAFDIMRDVLFGDIGLYLDLYEF